MIDHGGRVASPAALGDRVGPLAVGLILAVGGVTKVHGASEEWMDRTVVSWVLQHPLAILFLGCVELGLGLAYALGAGGKRLVVFLGVMMLVFTAALIAASVVRTGQTGCGCMGGMELKGADHIPYVGLARNAIVLALLAMDYFGRHRAAPRPVD